MPDSKNHVERQVEDWTVLVLTGQILLDDGDLRSGARSATLIDRAAAESLSISGGERIDSSGVGMMAAKVLSVRRAAATS